MKTLIIYHGNCLDGFGAAYAAWRHFDAQGIEAEYLPASHGYSPPDCRGREVYIVDFSYKRAQLMALCGQAERVTIIDHHITAQEDLAGLENEFDNLHVVFDMERSGAVLTWDFFHHNEPPLLLRHVQDRDLWQFKLDGTEAINTALMSYPFDFARWHQAAHDPEALEILRHEGETINRYRAQMIEQYKQRAVMGEIAGFSVPVVNAPHAIISELLGHLALEHPFAAGYQDKGNKRSWSLRSCREGGADVAKIAETFGGGGHRNAAGFHTLLAEDLIRPKP